MSSQSQNPLRLVRHERHHADSDREILGSSDPVGEGLVKSLARPGGNLTGLTYAVSPERFGKHLELLKEAVPGISRIAVW